MSLRSATITAVSSLLRTSPPLRAASLLSVLSFCDLHLFDSHLRAGSRVPNTGLLRAHAILMPDAEQPTTGLPLFLSRSGGEIPVLTSLTLTTLHQWFTCVHLHGAYLPIFFYGLFLAVHLPCLFNRAAQGDLTGLPVSSRRGACPHPMYSFRGTPPRNVPFGTTRFNRISAETRTGQGYCSIPPVRVFCWRSPH